MNQEFVNELLKVNKCLGIKFMVFYLKYLKNFFFNDLLSESLRGFPIQSKSRPAKRGPMR